VGGGEIMELFTDSSESPVWAGFTLCVENIITRLRFNKVKTSISADAPAGKLEQWKK
jgi:hypothetical protein